MGTLLSNAGFNWRRYDAFQCYYYSTAGFFELPLNQICEFIIPGSAIYLLIDDVFGSFPHFQYIPYPHIPQELCHRINLLALWRSVIGMQIDVVYLIDF